MSYLKASFNNHFREPLIAGMPACPLEGDQRRNVVHYGARAKGNLAKPLGAKVATEALLLHTRWRNCYFYDVAVLLRSTAASNCAPGCVPLGAGE